MREAPGPRLRRRGLRRLEQVGAFDHVRSRRDEIGAVSLVVPFGHPVRRIRVPRALRYRSAPGQSQPVAEIVRHLGQVHRKGVVVDDLEAGDRVGLATREGVIAQDHRVVGGIRPVGDSDRGSSLDAADDIGRRDLYVVERRRVAQPLLEPECPGEPIPREFRHRGREIGPEFGSPLFRRKTAVREQCSNEAAPQDLRVLIGEGAIRGGGIQDGWVFQRLIPDKRKVERATGECRPGRTRTVLGAAEGAGRADQNERDGQCERSRTTADPDSIDRA